MADMTRLPSVSQHSRQQPSSPRHSRNNSQCLWEIHSGHLHRWERTKKQSPGRQGNVFVLTPAPGITGSMKPNPLSCLRGFQRLNAPIHGAGLGSREGKEEEKKC